MPYKHLLNEIIGKLSTGVTIAGAIAANLPNVESLFRIGVSSAAMIASLVAGRYWWIKGSNALEERKHHRNKRKKERYDEPA